MKIKNMENFKSKLLVIGDVMLDEYLFGQAERISPEAPTPIFKYTGSNCSLGGAANVAFNLSFIGQDVSIMSVVGEDQEKEKLFSLIDKFKIDRKMVICEDGRQTIKKSRLLAQNNQQMLRIDKEDTYEINCLTENRLLDMYKDSINNYDAIFISDYMKGLLNESFTKKIIEIANNNNKKVFIDIKDTNYKKYSGAYLLKPNKNELSNITGYKLNNEEDIIKAAKLLKKLCDVDTVLVTLGVDGMLLLNDDEIIKDSIVSKQVYDVTGAGDTVLAYFGVAKLAGYNNKESVKIANIAANLKVNKVGTAAVELKEIKQYINKTIIQQDEKKILYKNDLMELKNFLLDKSIVFTNGCFDLLHVGHVECLDKAKQLGDILIVGLNSDLSVRKIKGKSRPILNELDRAKILVSLKSVDYVVIFDEETPCELINVLKPDVLVKGNDYSLDQVIGKDLVESYGGCVELITYVNDKSTTNMINKIKKQNEE